jgi:hypothetical protein
MFLLWKAIAVLIGSGIRFAGFRGNKVSAQGDLRGCFYGGSAGAGFAVKSW